MLFCKCLIIILILYFTRQTISEILKIVHYEDITQQSCGLKLSEIKPAIDHKSCFKWHKTILEQKNELKSIMNGRDAVEGEFPYTVLIRMSGWFSGAICTGAVLNSRWIVSVAHCFEGWSAKQLKIYPGITYYNETSNRYYKADKIIPYHKYTPEKPGKMYDMALIKLSSNIDFKKNNNVNSVCLPNRDYSNLTLLSTLVGWGDLNKDEKNERALQVTPIILNELHDSEQYFLISSDIKYGKGCPGDSGGPLVQYVNNRAVLIGNIIGPDCGEEYNFMKFTFIPFYIDWIMKTIFNNEY